MYIQVKQKPHKDSAQKSEPILRTVTAALVMVCLVCHKDHDNNDHGDDDLGDDGATENPHNSFSSPLRRFNNVPATLD